MTITRNPKTGRYEGDWRDRSIGRLHLSLRTAKVGEARTRYAAVSALIAQGYPDLVDRLRKGARPPLKIQAVERIHQAGGTFDELRVRTSAWPTLGKASADYVRSIEQHPERAERTSAKAKQHLDAAAVHFGADTPLDAITEDDVTAWQAALRAGTHSGRPLTENSLGGYLVALGALYRWVQTRETRRARKEERAVRTLYSPVDAERIPKFRATRVRFLSADEAQRLYVATPPQYRLQMALGLYAGLRLMEGLMLRPADVDLSLGLLYVQERETPHPWRPKGRKNRDVPLSAALRAIVERHLAAGYAGADYLTPAPPSIHHAARPETAAGGGPFTPTRWRAEFQRIAAAAGLEIEPRQPLTVTPHTLRHTFASWAVMEGVDLLTVARLMGHADTKQLVATYAHLAPEHRRRAVNLLADRLALPLDPEEVP